MKLLKNADINGLTLHILFVVIAENRSYIRKRSMSNQQSFTEINFPLIGKLKLGVSNDL